jgi:hypothetical protein
MPEPLNATSCRAVVDVDKNTAVGIEPMAALLMM